MRDTEPPDTLRSCEACGDGTMVIKCPWCEEGFQNTLQAARWAEFRKRMRFISGTYDFLQSMVQDLLARLADEGSDEALLLQTEGQDLLSAWLCADPLNGGRDTVTEELADFNKRSLDYLMGIKPQA